MSLLCQEGLKEILQQLECHFTWDLQKEHINPDELEKRIAEQVQFVINKSKVRNYNLLAYVKFLNDKKDEALENLQKAEEIVPIEYPEDVEKGSLVTWGNYAWVHYHMGNLTESQAYVEKVENTCKQLGSESPYKVELPQIDCDKGWALLKFGARNYEKAKESFEKAWEKGYENPEFYSGYALTVYHLEYHYAENRSWIESSLEPLSPLSQEGLKEILQQLECHFTWDLQKEHIDPDELEERIAEEIRFLISKSKVQNYNLLAYVKFLNDKNDEALENLQKAEETVPIEYPEDVEKGSLVTWGNYAWMHYHMGNLTESQAYVEKIENTCRQLGNESPYKMELPQIDCDKGWAQLKFGARYYEKAKESFEKALEKEPENPEFNSGYALTVYRLEYHYANNHSRIESSLEPLSLLSQEGLKEILQQLECHFTWELQKKDIDPDELEERIAEQIHFVINKSKVRNYNLLAYVKFLNDKKDEALENLQKAEETVPIEYPEDVEKGSLVTWGNYAWVHYHMGNLTESQAYVEKVENTCKQLGSESPYKVELPQIDCDKGWALLKFGARYYKKAKESFEKALEKEPENPEFYSGYVFTVYHLEDHFAENPSQIESSLEPLSLLSQEGLKEILQQLECHFTWELQKEHIDPDELEERIAEEIRFLISKSKVQNYNLLAYVKFLNDKKDEALENLQKAEETVPIEYPEDVEKGSLVTWGNYAWVHYHMGNLTESQAYVEKVENTCKQLGSESPYKMELPQIDCDKGWALLKFGARYYEKAKESFEKALEKEPENPEFYSGYALTVYNLEDHFAENPSRIESSLEPLSLLSQEGLKEILQELECHFTWDLQKEHIDPDELEERIAEEIRFLISKSKVQNYNLLAYVKFLNDKKDEALENLQKAEETVPIEYPEDVEKGSLVTWGNYAWVHYHMGNLTESQAYVEKIGNTCKQLGSESPYKVELPQIDCDKGWALLKFGARYYKKAKESFEKALDKEPENSEFDLGYALTVYRLKYHDEENPSRIESSLEPLSLLSQEGLKEILQQLECHFTWELQKEHIDLDELEERIAEEIRFLINKSKVRNYNLLAYVKFLNDKKDEALENLEKAEEIVPIEYPEDVEKGSLVTWGNYAWVHYHMGNFTESQAYVEQVENTCKQLGSESPYKVELPQIDCDKGWALLKFGARYYEKAKESFEKALEKEPENPEFNLGNALTIYHLEDQFAKNPSLKESSLEALKRALKLNPDDVFVLPLLAVKLQESDKKEEGEKWIKEALRKHPSIPYVLRYAAKFYRKKGDVETSLQHLEKALSLTPNSAFLHHQIGLCYRTQYLVMKNESRYDKCQVNDKMDELMRFCLFHFEKAVENKPEFFYANIDLAKRYAGEGMLQKADEAFQKLLTMSNLTPLEKQQAHFNYGRFQESDRRSQSEAIKHYFAALKIENDSIEREKCKCILKKWMDKKIRKGEAEAENFAILGFIHQLNGDKKKAWEAYEKAFDLDPMKTKYFNIFWKLSMCCFLRKTTHAKVGNFP